MHHDTPQIEEDFVERGQGCATLSLKPCLHIHGSIFRNLLFRILTSMIGRLDTFFRQIKSFIRFRLAFVFGLQTYLIDYSKIYQLNGLEPKNKG